MLFDGHESVIHQLEMFSECLHPVVILVSHCCWCSPQWHSTNGKAARYDAAALQHKGLSVLDPNRRSGDTLLFQQLFSEEKAQLRGRP